jgi:hypothetical protein
LVWFGPNRRTQTKVLPSTRQSAASVASQSCAARSTTIWSASRAPAAEALVARGGRGACGAQHLGGGGLLLLELGDPAAQALELSPAGRVG